MMKHYLIPTLIFQGIHVPMTPQATLPPAFPVVKDNGCPPNPKSSSFS